MTSVHALDATVARRQVDLWDETGRMNGIQRAEPALGDERFTATATTIADKVDAVLAPIGYTTRIIPHLLDPVTIRAVGAARSVRPFCFQSWSYFTLTSPRQ